MYSYSRQTVFFFFFQAEDGIRDVAVTGVQTCALPIFYGPNREGHVPAICEFLGIPCHASDPLTLGLALDKRRAKEVMSYHGVPTAPFVLAKSPADARNVQLPFPLFVKPAFEGSGKGVSVRSL